MNTSPPSESDPNTPAPPQQPGVPMPQRDRGAGFALAGFLCGLASFGASVVGSVFLVTGAYGGPRLTAPDLSPDDRLWVIVFAFVFGLPVALGALVGGFLCDLGSYSTSRRRLAKVGMVLCALTLVPFIVTIGLFVKLVWYCNTTPNCDVVPTSLLRVMGTGRLGLIVAASASHADQSACAARSVPTTLRVRTRART
jgi:MFS family permease